MRALSSVVTIASLVSGLGCAPRPERADSTAVATALPLGEAGSTELSAAQEYRERADEYAEERAAMSGPGTSVVRDAGVLRIIPRFGATVVLRDSIAPGDDYLRYVYAAHYPALGIHVVRVQYYEGQSALIVSDSTGRRTHVAELPLVAPDSARFAVVSFDLEAGYAPNLVEIWRPAADTMVTEFAQDFGTAIGPDSAAWRSADTLSFIRTRYITITDYERTPSRLIRRDGVWQIEPAFP